MNPFTSMAIDAYRKQEQARRRLNKAEAEVFKAARRVPSEEMDIWFVYTEIIRFEEDMKTSIENGDKEAVEGTAARLQELRAKASEIERRISQAQDIADAEDRPVSLSEVNSEGRWLTWPPNRKLIEGHEYLVRTKDGRQEYPREHRMSYQGTSVHGHVWNARPFAGTQQFRPGSIIATMDLGKSHGRDDDKRYMNKIIK